MNAQTWKWSNTCSFASDMAIAHKLIGQVMEQLETAEWSTKEKFAIEMVLEEALVNAVEHGNKFDPDKKVHFVCNLNDNLISVRIEDEGPGFDPDEVPDPTDAEHIMEATGRGVLLIRSYATRVKWNEKGTVLEFEKERSV
ncbi:MAG: ATP-binding protein [Planctomycetaceae bacterium]|nr:ATP-binding protein [Planctomycetaceae bacterium]